MQAEILELTYDIDAPLDAVWQCWSTPELVSIWYGPGIETVMHHFEFAEGGYWREEMKSPNGSMHGRSEFYEIIPGRKIVLRQNTVDNHGNIIPNPMMPNWPETMEATITFEDHGDHTVMSFKWEPHEANAEEIQVWNSMAHQMGKGWEKGFDILAKEARAIAKS